MKRIQGADLFCGAGGTTSGLLLAVKQLQRECDILAINHWNIAIDTHTRNHPQLRHLCESLDNVDPRKVIPSGRLDILCASPECTHHSIARGGKPCAEQSRATAWHILRWAEALRIESILIENVKEFRTWGPLGKRGRPLKNGRSKTYVAFLNALRSLDYEIEDRVVNAADFGDATSRERLLILCRRGRKVTWPDPTHAGNWRPAREIVDFSIKGKSIFGRTRPLSRNTLRRIEVGLRKFGGEPFVLHLTHSGGDRVRSLNRPLPTITTAHRGEMALAQFIVHLKGTQDSHIENSARSLDEPVRTITTVPCVALCEFLIKYYGSSDAASLSGPLPTVTTKARFALVEAIRKDGRFDIRLRMFKAHEYAAAMSFADGYQFAGNIGEQIRQIGNAVPVKLAAAHCKQLLS
jgi:DNA (cytosine-5)-methyltransferase 1